MSDDNWSRYRDAWLVGISVVVAMLAMLTYDYANDAQSLAERVAGQVQAQTIQREMICTETNQGACQALSERLISNLTAGQRREWACELFFYLRGPHVRAIREATGCPRPLSPPRPRVP